VVAPALRGCGEAGVLGEGGRRAGRRWLAGGMAGGLRRSAQVVMLELTPENRGTGRLAGVSRPWGGTGHPQSERRAE